MIKIDGLTVRYGTLVAVSDFSLTVERGEIFGLVGPNGAGKTTTIKVLAGLLLPDEGRVEVDGLDVVREREAVRERTGYMADFFGVYDYLTVHEYLAFFGGMYHVPPSKLEDRITRMLDAVKLSIKKEEYIGTLSRGMKQRLYFARALVHKPDLLLLDEPASGMDPRGRAEMVATLKDMNQQGTTILISSHILSELQDLCTSVGVMEASRLVSTESLRDGAVAAPRRKVLLTVAAEQADAAASVVKNCEGVHGVEKSGDGIVIETDDEDRIVGAVVKQLVTKGVPVLLPRTDAANIEEIFLKTTEGELM